MKEVFNSKYNRFFLAGLVLNILCAWFSAGFHHADEHFQVLEFCNYKLGNTPASQLPWEFHDKVRSALLPGIAFLLAKVMLLFNNYNPFILAFIVRLLAGLASWFIICKLCLLLAPKFKSPIAEKLLVLMSLFLWFVPYISVRFTSENVSGLLFLYALYGILKSLNNEETKISTYIYSGLLIGTSFFIRFHIVFAIAGLVGWVLFIKKIKVRYILALGIAALVAIALNVVLDYWFYGTWTFSPYNYYYANIVQHRASSFGVNPIWFYLTDFIVRAVPPLSVIILVMFFTGLFKNLKDPIVWVMVPFLVAHFLIGHKEMRFLFPVAFLFIYLSALGFDYFLAKEYYKKTHKYVYALCAIVTIPLLLYRTFSPAVISINYYKYLYENVPQKNTPLFITNHCEYYNFYCLNSSFYKNPTINAMPLDSLSQMGNYLQTNKPQSAFLLSKQNITSPQIIKGYTSKMVYSYFPNWILSFNFNNWQERTEIWRIYEFEKVD